MILDPSILAIVLVIALAGLLVWKALGKPEKPPRPLIIDRPDPAFRIPTPAEQVRTWRQRRILELGDEIATANAEIARRKKHKKAGQPVRPLRRQITAAMNEILRLERAA